MKPTEAPPFAPVIVYSRAEIAAVLTRRRHALGMTGEELDYHAGFSDRYTAKLERGDKPYGRQGFFISPGAEVWMPALGCCLVIMSEETAVAIGAVRAPSVADP